MTKMVPNEINPATSSAAEKKLFDVIRHSLNKDWVALHSLALMPKGQGNPWTEIDFVMIGPRGVFCLEVKGGRVRKEDGLWLFIDRNGNVAKKHIGPFEQASKSHFELRDYLRSHIGANSLPRTGFGVMTPDFTFHPLPPEATTEILYDETDYSVQGGFGRFIDRMVGYWSEKFPGVQDIGYEKICEIVNLLRNGNHYFC